MASNRKASFGGHGHKDRNSTESRSVHHQQLNTKENRKYNSMNFSQSNAKNHHNNHEDGHGHKHEDGHGHSQGHNHDQSHEGSHGHGHEDSHGHSQGHSHEDSHGHSQGHGHEDDHGDNHGHNHEDGHGNGHEDHHGDSHEDLHGDNPGHNHDNLHEADEHDHHGGAEAGHFALSMKDDSHVPHDPRESETLITPVDLEDVHPLDYGGEDPRIQICPSPADLSEEETTAMGFGDIHVDQRLLLERTLAILKPDTAPRHEEIEDIIVRAGFTVLQKRHLQLTPEQASDFYHEHFGKRFFPELIHYVISGPIVVLMLAREHAIGLWRYMIGPTDVTQARILQPKSLRAVYGTSITKNGFHGSDCQESAQREIAFFFNDAIFEPLLKSLSARDYMARYINPTLLKGLAALCRSKPADPQVNLNPIWTVGTKKTQYIQHINKKWMLYIVIIGCFILLLQIWLADWLLDNNPNRANIDQIPVVEQPTHH